VRVCSRREKWWANRRRRKSSETWRSPSGPITSSLYKCFVVFSSTDAAFQMGEGVLERGQQRPRRADRLPELQAGHDEARAEDSRVADRLGGAPRPRPDRPESHRDHRGQTERMRQVPPGDPRQPQHKATVEARRQAEHGGVEGRHPRVHHVHEGDHEQQGEELCRADTPKLKVFFLPVRFQHGDSAQRSHQLHLVESHPQELADQSSGAGVVGGDLFGQRRPRDHPLRVRQLQGGVPRAPQVSDPDGLLSQLRGLPHRVHGETSVWGPPRGKMIFVAGGVHAIRQHHSALRRRHELQGAPPVRVHRSGPRQLPGEAQVYGERRAASPDLRLSGQRLRRGGSHGRQRDQDGGAGEGRRAGGRTRTSRWSAQWSRG
jgi:hypothetical protein